MKHVEKFLEFNGKNISLLMADGTWWVAIKPICEALGVKYESQFERISKHRILSQLFLKQGMVAADGKMREMVCLPERYVYGWLFSINSDNEKLLDFQHKCYDILYNHFHGALTARLNILNELSTNAERMAQLEEELQKIELYNEFQDLKKRNAQSSKELKRLDVDLRTGQMSLFN
ncbi:MAG: phage antirepressor N-terminal domain-containing protein [Saprospiraceae bacterium]